MAQRRRRRIHPTPHHNRPRRPLLSRERRQATSAPHPVVREVADLLAEIGHRGRKRVIITRLKSHHPGRLGGAKPDREHRPEHDRHLPENVTRITITKHPLDTINDPDRLDPPLDHREQCPLITLVRGVLALHQRHISSHTTDLLTLRLVRAVANTPIVADLLRRHHWPTPFARSPLLAFRRSSHRARDRRQ